ncbi:MAG: transcriptional regulator [Gammaproteobacteria bacterium]|nr:transcriptional regulator [Gammaproteobacteria bacterium]NIR83219.1 transcriptional regulator [Gammaproteobacteria bacterium]NIR91027.1 transcriptional regulator [Gammaproteobacteria bacterium]NIU04384.1 transcriptional regulator [Gammaproteobacteria bacterium]NIV52607.1 transcriptional regulator [Gammaproteobacteria bacterium]
MFRKDLIDFLRARPYTLAELADALESNPKDLASDLRHLFRSLRHQPYRPVVEPARCRHCGFDFRGDKLLKPGKCPQCRSTWIEPPRVRIEEQ